MLLPAMGLAAARVGELEVRSGSNAAPCFTVSAEEEMHGGSPQFQSIVVRDATSTAPMWSMAMPKGRTFALAPYMCVPYGGRPAVLPQTPAVPLQRGRIYEVGVHALPYKPGGPRQYRARFCVGGGGTATAVIWLHGKHSVCPHQARD